MTIFLNVIGWMSGTAIGRAVSGLLVGLIAWFGFAKFYEHKGAVKERAKYVQAGQVNAGKAKAARKSLSKTADKDLFDQYMRWGNEQ